MIVGPGGVDVSTYVIVGEGCVDGLWCRLVDEPGEDPLQADQRQEDADVDEAAMTSVLSTTK